MLVFKSNLKFVSIKYLTFIFVFFLTVSYKNDLKSVEYNSYSKAKIQILNKVTGKAEVFDIKINSIFHFDNKLSLIIKACYKTTQKYAPEDVMFIQVAKSGSNVDSKLAIENNIHVLNNANEYVKSMQTPDTNNTKEMSEVPVDIVKSKLIFSGWIFSNIPEVSSLTDKVYDISIIKCLN